MNSKGTEILKIPVGLRSLVMETVQVKPKVWSQPLHAVNIEPGAGVAVNVACSQA